MHDKDQNTEPAEAILADTEDYIDVTIGIAQWMTPDDQYILEEDYRVAGEVWRVHKTDADPYPSNPHAHCIDGQDRFKGCKLHLGTRELFDGRRALGRHLNRKQFNTLIGMIRPKFPGITLPLTT